jgi:hypothetical protein
MRLGPAMLALSAAALLACEPLTTPAARRGPLEIEVLDETAESVPLEYGELVAVTPVAGYDFVQALWFVRPDKSIVSVRVDVSLGRITQVMTIPRR